jgi:hypothetical protein
LEPSIAQLYNRVADRVRGEFTDAVVAASLPHGDDLDWWVESPSSRNTFSSPLFHHCCCLALVAELWDQEEEIDLIRVDSSAMAAILSRLARRRNKVVHIQTRQPTTIVRQCRKLVKFVWILGFFGRLFLAARLSRRTEGPAPAGRVILVDTFLYGDDLSDQHYDGMMDALPPEVRDLVYFVPTYVNVEASRSYFDRLRRCPDRKFLLKEDYLQVSDYGWALGHLLRARRLRCVPVHFWAWRSLSSFRRRF